MNVAPTPEELRPFIDHPADAERMARSLAVIWQESDPVRRWQRLSQEVLRSHHPHALHQQLFQRNYADWSHSVPPPAWIPTAADRQRANLTRVLQRTGCETLEQLASWAREQPAKYWDQLIRLLSIRFRLDYSAALDLDGGSEHPRWLCGARLNIVDSCLQHSSAAIIAVDEWGRREILTMAELQLAVTQFAGALRHVGLRPNDGVALVMPLSIEAVIAYLGTIAAGGMAVGIAESFATPEIERRVRLGQAKLVVAQDSLVRQGKPLPVYDRLKSAALPSMIISRCGRDQTLRPGDQRWEDFLVSGSPLAPIECGPEDLTTLLFSSGTTGDPKAIPWSQATPIQCAADGFLYQDIQSDDVLAWPTGMGWMMGPWLIYAGLINGARVVLFDGHAATPAFVNCVEAERVTMLGVVPSLVAAWQRTGIWERADWSRIRAFSSTGECSHPHDMLALMSRAHYRPVIEYCGGTELAGGYLTSTLLRPNVPSCFNQVAFGVGVSLQSTREPSAARGEAFLSGVAIGMSTELLNADHHQVYYAATPTDPAGQSLRRHGDLLASLSDGYYRVLGRADDAMNLGGIKVSAVEIERICNQHANLVESAAVSVSDPDGGPARLIVYAVVHDMDSDLPELQADLQQLLREHLSPQFKISEVRRVETLPRTASNKVVRRLLRE